MSTKSIQQILPPPPPHMVGDGFRVHNFFPGYDFDNTRMSPFYLIDYNSKIEFSPSAKPRAHCCTRSVFNEYQRRNTVGNEGFW